MATFEAAIPVLMMHEGAIGDCGDGEGVTAYGWTPATCGKLGIDQPTTSNQAVDLYRQHFWKPLYDHIVSQNVATKLFDDTVNQGEETAVLTLQRALCQVGSTVEIDGVFGPCTLAAVNYVPEVLLLPWMRVLQFATYEHYIGKAPHDRNKFRNNLAGRAAWPDPTNSITRALLAGTYEPGELHAPTSRT